MTSVVSICNLALTNIGKKNITNLNEASTEAKACNQFYDHTLRIMLQAYPYRWAGKTLSLAGITNDKPLYWQYAFARPVDCLKVRRIDINSMSTTYADLSALDMSGVSQQGLPYDIEGQTLYCNIDPCFLIYTATQTDPTKFPELFVDALSWHLAVRLAMPVTRDPSVRAEAFKMATAMQAQAEALDANEVRETTDFESEYRSVRETGVR